MSRRRHRLSRYRHHNASYLGRVVSGVHLRRGATVHLVRVSIVNGGKEGEDNSWVPYAVLLLPLKSSLRPPCSPLERSASGARNLRGRSPLEHVSSTVPRVTMLGVRGGDGASRTRLTLSTSSSRGRGGLKYRVKVVPIIIAQGEAEEAPRRRAEVSTVEGSDAEEDFLEGRGCRPFHRIRHRGPRAGTIP